MERLGPKTRELLLAYGLDPGDLDEIEAGDVSWDVYHPHPEAEGDLLLVNLEGAHRFLRRLTKEQVEELINTWEFERRESGIDERPSTFPCGEFDDWTGIRPNSDWRVYVTGYRQAVETLAAQPPRATVAPYLYLCRHLLELQMKAIIMLDQQVMGLVAELPSHHDLQRLWTSVFPIAIKCRCPESNLAAVRQVIDDYHAVDPRSISFRYPVTKGNRPVDLPSFLQSFSHQRHASQFAAACDVLHAIILQLRFAALLAGS